MRTSVDLPEEDAYRVELVRGRLVRSPRPAPLHGRLVVRLGRELDEFVEDADLGVTAYLEGGAARTPPRSPYRFSAVRRPP